MSNGTDTIDRASAGEAKRQAVIDRLGATNDKARLLKAVDTALIDMEVLNPAAGGQSPSRVEIVARKEQIRGDIERALDYYKGQHPEKMLSDAVDGPGGIVKNVLEPYVQAKRENDKDPQMEVPLSFLNDRISAASDTADRAVISETIQAQMGPAARLGGKVDNVAAQIRNAGPAVPQTFSRRQLGTTLVTAGGLGAALALLLSQKGCPSKTVDVVPLPVTPEPKLPVNFRKVESSYHVPGDTEEKKSSILLTERAENKLVFFGKETSRIDAGSQAFSENATTEIHMTDPTQHAGSFVIETPGYARVDRQKAGTGYSGKEQDRPKVDLCFHPSVLANYNLTASSVTNGQGKTSQDIVLSFDPKPSVNIANLEPFEITIKGHGIDRGGVFHDNTYDQAGIDQIKLVDSRGQVIKAVDTIKLSTAREFTNAINTLQLEAERSNDATTPLHTKDLDNLSHYAGKRFQDISHSHGEGQSTRRTPAGRTGR